MSGLLFGRMKSWLILFLIFSAVYYSSSFAQTADEKKTAAIFPFHFTSIDPEEREVISGLNELPYNLFVI